jgi:Rad3-related DNA helicase
MPLDLSDFTPAMLGLPEKFEEFRPAQIEAIEWVAEQFDSGKRFVGVCLPTGAGKTLFGMGLSKALGARTAVLTVTKGLQEQYKRDFPKLVDIRGKENYECAGKPPNRCKYGPHEGCNLAGDLGCVYESARWEAKNAQAIITNYSYWVRANKFGPQGLCLMQPESIEPVNPFELIEPEVLPPAEKVPA